MVEPRGGGKPRGVSLRGKTLYIPRMSEEGARLMAAAFRSMGIDARVSPESDARTRELGARYLSGEECYPAQITLGEFMKVVEAPGFDPEQTLFFMPGAEGPCRFGQYTPAFRHIFKSIGQDRIRVISPSSRFGYAELGDLSVGFERRAWRGLVAGDILRKLRLMNRPYEKEAGAVDALIETALTDCEEVLGREGESLNKNLRDLRAALVRVRDAMRALPRRVEDRPLVGVVGEIFCRLSEYSNGYVLRRIERLGGEAWLSDITEWVHYTRFFRQDLARELGGQGAGQILKMKIVMHIQRKDEHALLDLFAQDFAGREEPHDMTDFLALGEPYLPFRSGLGEMALSVAKAVYLHGKGVDAILDVSPFTCMNGIVSESVYPRLSRDCDEIPIRNLYYDGTERDVDRDLGMFLELARAYRHRRRRAAGVGA